MKRVILICSLLLAGCTKQITEAEPSQTASPLPQSSPTPTPLVISATTNTFTDDTFAFSLSYPDNFTFEPQKPYLGGTIKAVGLRVDGLTDSQMFSKDIARSLKGNDLYCNLDQTGGGAVCTNTDVAPYQNPKGASGYLVKRTKVFYPDEGDEITYQDEVYALNLGKANGIGASPYCLIILSVKLPTPENLNLLKTIADSVVVE